MISLYVALFWGGLWAGCWGWYYFTHSWSFGDDWSADENAPLDYEKWKADQERKMRIDRGLALRGLKEELARPAAAESWVAMSHYKQMPANFVEFVGLKTREELRRELLDMDQRYQKEVQQHIQEIDEDIRRAEEKKRAHDEGKDNPPPPRPDPSIGRTYR